MNQVKLFSKLYRSQALSQSTSKILLVSDGYAVSTEAWTLADDEGKSCTESGFRVSLK